jgi:hypothetical protein
LRGVRVALCIFSYKHAILRAMIHAGDASDIFDS